MAYQKRQTAITAAVPVLIVPISLAIDIIAKQFCIDMTQGRSYEIAIAIYGGVSGFIHWIKNRKKK